MRATRWLSTLLAATLAFGLASAARAGTLEDIVKRGEVRVAVQTQGPPFSFIDKNGERTGSSVELVRLLAKEMGVKVKFLDFDWDGLIPALLSRKADMLAADMTPTMKRATRIAFTDPFMYTGSVVFVKSDSPFKSVDDVRKAKPKIAVLLGSTGETDAKKVFAGAEFKSYKGGGPLLMDAVLKGHADAGVNDGSAVRSQIANFPPGSMRTLPSQLSRSPLSFAVRYDSLDLLEAANLFFLHINLDGRLAQNLDYWVNSLDWKKDH